MTQSASDYSTVTFPLNKLIAASENYEGFCLACQQSQSGCEPDARNYECESCGERQVFGAEELILMGHGR
jgi:hypothetical protein